MAVRSADRTTARTYLRPFEPADAAELLALFRDPVVRRFLLDDVLVSAEWVDEEIADSARRFTDARGGLWTVRLQAGGPVVGFAGFRDFFDPPRLQLLYGLHPDVQGRGLATEVAAEVCRFGFEALGFDEVRAAIDSPHDASRAVLERLGFTETHRTEDGEYGTTFFRLGRGTLRDAHP